MNRLMLWFTKITALPVQWLYFRRKTYYVNKKEQSRSIKGPAIIISNHTSVYDFALYLFTFYGRVIRPLIAEILYQRNKFFSWFLKALGGIKVDRITYDFSFMSDTIDIINKGGISLIFPESRLPRKDEKEILDFKPSFVYIALETNAPIIPVYTNGSYGKKERARVIIGEKIYLKDIFMELELNEKEKIEYLCEYVRNYICSLERKMYEIENEKRKKNSKNLENI